MSTVVTARNASADPGAFHYQRYRPKKTLLFQLVSVYANLHDTGSVDESVLSDVIRTVFDLTPAGIISTLDLRRPIYQQTATYGHFGRSDMGFSWERLDRIDALLANFPDMGESSSRQGGGYIA